MIKIVLADDHVVVRKGLKAFLNTESDFDIIGEAGDGLETVNLVTDLKPDVLVLDMVMPGINGLEVIRQLRERNSETRAIILTLQNHEAYLVSALTSGAMAYILKESPCEELIEAIRAVIAGQRYISPSLKSCPDYSRSTFINASALPY
ncbi:MAG: response regulator transcription factor [Dehalococcoidales bacterium]|nr:response regulator transcription factor [Dehalococcoidales bacterium]